MDPDTLLSVGFVAMIVVVGGGVAALFFWTSRRQEKAFDELVQRTGLTRTSRPLDLGAVENVREVIEGQYEGYPVRLKWIDVHAHRAGREEHVVHLVYELDCFPTVPAGVVVAEKGYELGATAPDSMEVAAGDEEFRQRFDVLAPPDEVDNVSKWLSNEATREAMTDLFGAFPDGDKILSGERFTAKHRVFWSTKPDEVIACLDTAVSVGEHAQYDQ